MTEDMGEAAAGSPRGGHETAAAAPVVGPYRFGHIDGPTPKDMKDMDPQKANARLRAKESSKSTRIRSERTRSEGGEAVLGSAKGKPTTRSLPALGRQLSIPHPTKPLPKGEANRMYVEKISKGGPRSYMGHVPVSTMRTGGTMKFTEAKRFGYEHQQYLSKQHCDTLLQDWTPGPGTYPIPPSVGKQQLSQHADHGAAIVTSGEGRFEEKFAEHAPPGPGQYQTSLPLLNKRVLSQQGNPQGITTFAPRNWKLYPEHGTARYFYCQDSPSHVYDLSCQDLGKNTVYATSRKPTFGKGLRDIDPSKPNEIERRAAAVPGPGAYEAAGISDHLAAGGDVRPTYGGKKGKKRDKSPAKGYSFTGQDRYKAGEVSLSPEGAKSVLNGREGQGPATYTLRSSVGKQVIAYKKTAPSSSFSKTSRFSQAGVKPDKTPGPGSYCV